MVNDKEYTEKDWRLAQLMSLAMVLAWMCFIVMAGVAMANVFAGNTNPFTWLLLTISISLATALFVMITEDTLNLVQSLGPFYWLVREGQEDQRPFVRKSFMRETDFPWRRGRGLEFGMRYGSIQIGLCRRVKVESEIEGLLQAMDGEELDATPGEIKTWGVSDGSVQEDDD